MWLAHGDAREGKWRGNWRMEWVASTLHTTSEHGVSSITTADAHTSAASSRLNWSPRRFKWTRPFRRKTKSGFCARAITIQLASNAGYTMFRGSMKSTGYLLQISLRHRVPSHFNWRLLLTHKCDHLVESRIRSALPLFSIFIITEWLWK